MNRILHQELIRALGVKDKMVIDAIPYKFEI
jgi:hypothetical protein